MPDNHFQAAITGTWAVLLAFSIPAGATESLPEPVRRLIAGHCTDCHDADAKKGGVNLDFESLDLHAPASATLLERIHRALASDEMPPAKKPRLDPAEKSTVLAWLDETLVNKVPRHAVGLRRLTRVEYEKTIVKVFGIPFRVSSGFPADTNKHGFDNIAESLMLSPPLLDAYMESAIEVADILFPAPQEPTPPPQKWTIPPDDLSSIDGHGPSNKMVDGKMRLIHSDYVSTASRFAAPASGYYRVKFSASAFQPEDDKPLQVKLQNLKDLEIPTSGTVEHRGEIVLHSGDSFGLSFTNSPLKRLDSNVPYEGFREALLERFSRHPRLLAAWLPLHEPVPNSATGAIRLKTYDTGREVQKKQVEKRYEAELARPELDLAAATPEAARKVVDAMYVNKIPRGFGGYQLHYYGNSLMSTHFTYGPALDIESIEIEGPIPASEGARYAVEHPRYGRSRALQHSLLGAEAAKLTSPTALDTALQRMLAKIFRRDATPTESQRYRALIEQHRQEGHSFESSMHLALRTALVSPQFIYREGAGSESTADAELATRLSYFLALRPPDDLLRAAVADGSFSRPGGIRRQAERLLASPEVKDFVRSFVGQWLGTRKIPEIMPDSSLGAYDGDTHGKAMMQEPELVFSEILRENRPLQDFIAPDFTHTHPVVGKQMYGLTMEPPDYTKPFAMTRVALPRDGKAGGLLGMSGVMMATANGVDTQPVYRGKWVLETILNDPPPPPPESVPAITPDTTQAKTIRDLMAAHTTEASCAGCHRKLDPPGFLLENYDALGQWRESYPIRTVGPRGNTVTKPGPPVDAAAMMPDGTQLKDIRDLKLYVLNHPERFGRALTEKLFLYGAGRLPSYAERKKLHAISDRVVTAKGGFRDLILAMVESEPFTQR
jgi:mono/diheme cytochrome c family protein